MIVPTGRLADREQRKTHPVMRRGLRDSHWGRAAARIVSIASVSMICLTGAGLASASLAQASTDFYCQSCWLGGYNHAALDPYAHWMTGSYAHDLTFYNGWIGAGDSHYGIQAYAPGEVFVSYCGCEYLNGLLNSHIYQGSYANGHTDY